MELKPDLQFQCYKVLLDLLKERAKEQPNPNVNLENEILNSICKKDYLEIVDRINLTKKNNSNGLIELLGLARDSGKYGVKINSLDNANLSAEEKLRVYLLELNKSLKQIGQFASTSWKTFKKIRDSFSSFPKAQQESFSIPELMVKIKSFKDDLDDNKLSVSKVGGSVIKQEPIYSSAIKPVQKSETDKELQQLRGKLSNLYANFANGSKQIVARDSEQTNKILQDIKQKFLQNQNTKTKLDDLRKQLQNQKAPELIKKQSSSTPEFKDKLIDLFLKILQTRKITDLKLIDKQMENVLNKKPQFLMFKQTFKKYITDQEENQEPIGLRYQKSQPLGSKSSILQDDFKLLHEKHKSLQKSKLQIQKELQSSQKNQRQMKSKFVQVQRQIFSKQQIELKLKGEVQKIAAKNTDLIRQLQIERNKLIQSKQQVNRYKEQKDKIQKQFQAIVRQNVEGISTQQNLFQQLLKKNQDEFNLLSRVKILDVQNAELRKQLQQQKDKFVTLENSRASLQNQLVSYQQMRFTPENRQKQLRVGGTPSQNYDIKEFPSPVSQHRTEVMLDCIKHYQQIEANLKGEIQKKQQFIANLQKQVSELANNLQVSKIKYQELVQIHQKTVNKTASVEQIADKGDKQFAIRQQQYKAEIEKLKTQRDNYMKMVKQQHKNQLQQMQSQFSQFFINQSMYQAQLKKKIAKIQQQKQQIQQISSQFSQFFINQSLYQSQIKKKTIKVQQLKNQLQQMRSQFSQFFINQDLYQALNKSKIALIQQQKNQLQQLHSQFNQFFANQSLYRAQIKKKLITIQLQKYQLHQLRQQFNHVFMNQSLYQAQIKKKIVKIQQQNNQLQEIRSHFNQFFINQGLYQSEIKKKIMEIQELKNQLQEIRSHFSQFFTNQNLYQAQLKKKIIEIQQQKHKQRQLQAQLSKSVDNQQNLKVQIFELKGKLVFQHQARYQSMQIQKIVSEEVRLQVDIDNNSKEIISNLESQIVNLKQQVSQFQSGGLFNHVIFQNKQSQKEKLIRLVTKQMGKDILKTRLIFKYDPLNSTNFHKYIDNVQSFLLVVETKNAIIGGYYVGVLKEHTVADRYGFLFSLNQSQCYEIKQGKRVVVYDTFFLIFGNSQIRIKANDLIVFSNFGIGSSYFDAKGKIINDFLRENTLRETPLINLQIYKVTFQDDFAQSFQSLQPSQSKAVVEEPLVKEEASQQN